MLKRIDFPIKPIDTKTVDRIFTFDIKSSSACTSLKWSQSIFTPTCEYMPM